ncbi:MAG: hypothetical protein DDT40_01837 [candidate division WS2 bacterium]|nr:hypothetical protein [Candidatus Psychracetigena formicireducens]
MTKKIGKLQRNLIIAALVTIILISAGVIYSLGFLSNNLLRALRPQVANEAGIVEFNLGGFESLGL